MNVFAVLTLLLLSLVSCGDSERGARRKVAGNGGSSGITENAIDPGKLSDAGATGCTVHCSPDLRSIVNCNGQVVRTCSDDTACAAGNCVEPCEAAKANPSALGCDFYSAVPASHEENRGSCFAAMLANTSPRPVKIGVEYGGTSLDISTFARIPKSSGAELSYDPLPNGELAPQQMAILFLAGAKGTASDFVACPTGIEPAVAKDVSIRNVGRLKTFRITATAPIAAYDIYPFGGKASYVSSATLLLPTSAWGKSYVLADAYPKVGQNQNPFSQIVAAEDDTHVTINPVVEIPSGPDVAGAPAGQPQTYTLAKGEAIQFEQANQLAGSPLQSDKPIAVWGGHTCMQIPASAAACDSAHQQLLAVNLLGSEYAAVRFGDRAAEAKEQVPWLIVGAVDDTKLEYFPSKPPNAPKSLSFGQMYQFTTSEAFTVRSLGAEQPFYMAAYMTGSSTVQQLTDNSDGGDPEFVNVVSSQQWLDRYVFLTDHTYKNTELVFVRKKAADGLLKDVTLACAGVLSGWTAFDATNGYEFTRVRIIKGGTPIGTCTSGVQTAMSEAPFGLTVWGWDDDVSYAYPAGMAARQINTIVPPVGPK